MSTGRPRKITDEQVAILSESIAMSMTDEDACARADIDYEYFRAHWKNLDYLRDTIRRAKAEKKYRRLQSIESGQPGWQSVAWILERTDQQFKKNAEVQVNNTVENKIDVDALREDLIKLQGEAFLKKSPSLHPPQKTFEGASPFDPNGATHLLSGRADGAPNERVQGSCPGGMELEEGEQPSSK